MTSQILAAAASIALIGAGVAGTSGTRAFEAMPGVSAAFADGEGGGSTDKCRVDVIRSGNPGAADITRQVLSDGSCVCSITTGPSNGNGSAEDIVTALLRDRTCADAPAAGKLAGDPAPRGAGSSLGYILGGIGVIGVVAGLAVAGGSDSNG